jgi:hypothetical protein
MRYVHPMACASAAGFRFDSTMETCAAAGSKGAIQREYIDCREILARYVLLNRSSKTASTQNTLEGITVRQYARDTTSRKLF